MLSMLLMIAVAASLAQSESRSLETNATNIAVTDFEIEGKNINKLLARIAYKYDVPISFEVATNEDLLNSKLLTVHLKKGILADVLDDIVRQKPSYMWQVSDNTIKVFPKSAYRDPLLQTLLEIRIGRIVVQKSTVKFNFIQTLTRSPELKNLLASYGVRPLNEGFLHSDFATFGGDFSLDLKDMPVRSILDSVIKTSKTKYWFINRDVEDKKFFFISF